MAGRNEQVRAELRKVLLSREHRGKSDTAIAAAMGCHRSIVRQVRGRLIAQRRVPVPPRYKAGAVVRGGYVLNERGKVVKELDWFIGSAEELSRETGAMLRALLERLRHPHPATASSPPRTPRPAPSSRSTGPGGSKSRSRP